MVPKHYIYRLLSNLNRNPLSDYYGCFDRNFWHYKMASGFPSAIYQHGVLSLSLAYRYNIFELESKVLEYIEAGMLFWSKLQHSDGSFDEWFPNEHSHVATAFTSFGMSESMLILGDSINHNTRIKILESLKKSGNWLCRNPDELVLNHTAGAITALYNIFLLTRDNFFLKALEKNIAVLLDNQNEEGWFTEYDGPDIGYLTLSIYYLAQYWQKSKDERIQESLGKALNFLVNFMHPDGSLGGEYSSRGTNYFLKYGFFLLSDKFESARQILKHIDKYEINFLDIADERYYIFFFLPDFLFSQNHSLDYESVNLSEVFLPREIFYKNSGFFIKNTGKYNLVVNLKMGGLFKAYDVKTGKLIEKNLGVLMKFKNSLLTSLNNKTRYSFRRPDAIEIENQLAYAIDRNPLKNNLWIFRIFNHTFFRFKLFRFLFNSYLKKNKIKNTKQSNIKYKRYIYLKEEAVTVQDEIINCRDKFIVNTEHPIRYSPTGNYIHEGV